MAKATWETTATFADLRGYLSQPGCAICSCVGQSRRRFLEDLMYENVNDVGLRDRLRKGGGFCLRHVRALLDRKQPLGTAILYGDLLRQRLRSFAARGGPRALPLAQDCPLCQVESESARRASEVFAYALDAGRLQAEWEASEGFCWPHFIACRRLVRGQRAVLDRVEERCLVDVATNVEALIASYDYTWTGTRSSEVAGAWRKVVAVVTGETDPTARDERT